MFHCQGKLCNGERSYRATVTYTIWCGFFHASALAQVLYNNYFHIKRNDLVKQQILVSVVRFLD